MANTPATSAGKGSKPGIPNQPEISAWKPLLAFIFVVIALVIAGYTVFQQRKEDVKRDEQDDLGAIAELKVGQITNWMEGRKSDAYVLSKDPLFLAEVDRWLQQGAPAGEARARLARRMTLYVQAHINRGYTSISLCDDHAMPRLFSSPDSDQVNEDDRKLMLESIRDGQIIFSDIHQEGHGTAGASEIDIVAPLIVGKGERTHAIGTVIFHIDPDAFLFPLIKNWPTPSPSAENILVRRDGDDVVFLNELRHFKNTPLVMRFPLSRRQLLAAQAVTGHTGLAEGVDYRGMPVVGMLKKVPGTSWFMISKVDQAEVYAPINRLARWVVALMLALIGAGGGLSIYLRQKEKKYYESELKRHALEKHLDYLSRYANDIILLHDRTGRIIDYNDRALKGYGYTATELANMNFARLQAMPTATFEELISKIDAAGSLRFESEHVRKNGTVFPVEASMQLIDVDGKKLYQAVIRDITEYHCINQLLNFIVQRSWEAAGQEFLPALAQRLGQLIGVDYVIIGKLGKNAGTAETMGLYAHGEVVRNISYSLAGTPCENVIGKGICTYRQGVQQMFPDDVLLAEMKVESYLGIPLWDSAGQAVGLIAVLDGKPLTNMDMATALLKLAASSAGAELERQRKESSLGQFKYTLDQTLDCIFMFRENDFRFIYVNEGAVKQLGYSMDELLNMTPLDIKPEFTPERFQKMVQPLRGGILPSLVFETVHRHKNGCDIPVEIFLQLVRDGENEPRFMAIVRDISASKLAERKLHELTAHLQTVREEERTRIARELHDELGQSMTALRFDLKWLDENVKAQEQHVHEKLHTMSALVTTTVDAIRRISEDLRPSMLDDLGLAAAIENHVGKFSAQSGIRCDLSMSHADFELDPQVATALFRLVQEGLTNVARHSGASHVLIRLQEIEDRMLLIMQDNGNGLPPVQDTHRKTYGLQGMRERIMMLGGTLDVFNEKGAGVRIEAHAPKQVKEGQ
jgi:PAS domain S-box-containing protein